jgi:ornithine cyclodeaminase
MRNIFVLTERDLRQCVHLDRAAIDVVEQAFRALASGKVVMPPILSMEIPDAHGEIDVKTAYIPGFDGFAIKVSPGFFDNPKLGLPSLNGLMILFSAKTGLVEALLLDNGYLTDVRTAAAGAVAARHLAPREVRVAGVLGTGVQARLQIQAAHLVRPFSRVLVWGRDREKAVACARDIAAAIGVEAFATDDPGGLVRESQLVVTTTPAREPVIRAEWVAPGTHVTAIGSDLPGKQELEPALLERADKVVADRLAQARAQGEIQHLRDGDVYAELGELANGTKAGRERDDEITVADLTGVGVLDAAMASFVTRRAVERGLGRELDV